MQEGPDGKEHGQVVAHLTVVFQSGVEPAGEQADADEGPVGKGEGGEEAAGGEGCDAAEADGAVDYFRMLVLELVRGEVLQVKWGPDHM